MGKVLIPLPFLSNLIHAAPKGAFRDSMCGTKQCSGSEITALSAEAYSQGLVGQGIINEWFLSPPVVKISHSEAQLRLSTVPDKEYKSKDKE